MKDKPLDKWKRIPESELRRLKDIEDCAKIIHKSSKGRCFTEVQDGEVFHAFSVNNHYLVKLGKLLAAGGKS